MKLLIRNQTRRTTVAGAAEAAKTSSARRKGLLGRDGLPEGGGLWIVPCESVHTFFMRFPIDLVYLDRGKIVRKVRHAVPAWRLSLCLGAHSILELPAGAARDSSTEPGDQIAIEELP